MVGFPMTYFICNDADGYRNGMTIKSPRVPSYLVDRF